MVLGNRTLAVFHVGVGGGASVPAMIPVASHDCSIGLELESLEAQFEALDSLSRSSNCS